MSMYFDRSVYEILDVPPNVDSKTLRKKYKRLVRQFTPEHYPDKFEEINLAYRTITGDHQVQQKAVIYRSPLTWIEKIVEDSNEKAESDDLLPLSLIPETIFDVELEILKILE